MSWHPGITRNRTELTGGSNRWWRVTDLWLRSGDQRQSLQWKSPTSSRLKKARMAKPQIKVMLIALFDVTGIVQAEFLSQTINNTFTGTSCDVWCSQCERRGDKCTKKYHGCFTTTMLRGKMYGASGNFLLKITLLCWNNLHTHQTWLPVIYSWPQVSHERNSFIVPLPLPHRLFDLKSNLAKRCPFPNED